MLINRENIVFVDGFAIRNTLDDDFAGLHANLNNFALFHHKHYVPAGEVWIDHIYKKSGEVDFLLEVEEADALNPESNQVSAREWLNKRMCKRGSAPNYEIKRERNGEIDLVFVDGAIIRKHIDCQFVYGGHDFVYDYVPKNEIWIDAVNDPEENKYVIVHENLERQLMKEGKSYDIAHRFANVAEIETKVKDGVAHYPGDALYPWTDLSTEEIIRNHYVIA